MAIQYQSRPIQDKGTVWVLVWGRRGAVLCVSWWWNEGRRACNGQVTRAQRAVVCSAQSALRRWSGCRGCRAAGLAPSPCPRRHAA